MKTQIHLSWLLFHGSYVPFNFNRWCHTVHKNNGDKYVTPTIKNEIRKLTVTPSTIEIFDNMVIKIDSPFRQLEDRDGGIVSLQNVCKSR